MKARQAETRARLPPATLTAKRSMKKQFFTNAPSHRNAHDLFADKWACDLGEIDASLPSGGMPGFRGDPRPAQAAARLGRDARFDGYDVLELGPLEAAHTYQLERLGAARITAVEANSEAFLKCLIVKNIARLDRSTFLLGDATGYLAAPGPRHDLIFACGILYHMQDPVELIRLAAARSDRLFLWTHYYADVPRLKHLRPRTYRGHGLSVPTYEMTYRNSGLGTFWGGNRASTNWLELPTILAVLAHFGLTETVVIADDHDHLYGPNVTLAASRPGAPPPA